MPEFSEVYHHRLRYFLTPQFEMYHNIRKAIGRGEFVCDYGCGNGIGSVLLSGGLREVVGVDSDEEAVAFAKDAWGHLCHFKHDDWTQERRRPKSHAEWWAGFDAPVLDNFEVIVCLEVIEHVEDPAALLAEFRQRLKAGGRLYLSTLNHNSQFRKNRGHIGKFCLDDFSSLVSEYFPDAKFTDYTLENELEPGSSLTPMVAIVAGEK